MLKMISSAQFVGVMIMSTCGYYLFILIKYYRQELRNLLPRRHKYENKGGPERLK